MPDFEAGTDDYLVKTLEFKELLLRARVRTRRHTAAAKRVLRTGALWRR